MRGLLEIMRFELRYQRRSPVFYAIAGFFFLMTFFAMSSESVTIGGGTAALNLNAPYVILQTQLVFSFIGMFAAVAFVASAITRDYEARTAELIFTTGVSEAGLVLGRFFGSATFAVLAGTAALLGTLLGSLMPWLDQERVAAFSIAPFAHAWLWIVLPNYFLACALFYTAAALTRSISAAYVTAVIFLVGYVVASYFVEPDQIETAALLDPLGMTAFAETTRYWTVFQRNTLLPEGSLYANRAIWMGVALVFVGFTALVYRFRLSGRGGRRWFRRRADAAVPSAPAAALPSYTLSFDLAQALRQFASQLAMDVRGVVKSVPFYVILALGVFNVMGGFEGSINNRFGTPVYPVTSMMLEVISGSFLFIVMVIIMYYSGELVHRERQHKLNEIVDATPYPNVTMALAKIGALWFVIATLLLVVAATAVLMQALYDYDRYEIGLYLQGLFLVNGFDFFLLAVLAVAIQVLLPNKWFGLLVLVFVFILMQTLYNLGFERYLYLFGLPLAQHSDMNGYGHFVRPMLWYGLYWRRWRW